MEEFNTDEIKDLIQSTKKDIHSIHDYTQKVIKQKMVAFAIRWTITIVLYILLWNRFAWIKWTLFLTIPLGIMSLFMLYKFRKESLERTAKIKHQVKHSEDIIEDIENQ